MFNNILSKDKQQFEQSLLRSAEGSESLDPRLPHYTRRDSLEHPIILSGPLMVIEGFLDTNESISLKQAFWPSGKQGIDIHISKAGSWYDLIIGRVDCQTSCNWYIPDRDRRKGLLESTKYLPLQTPWNVDSTAWKMWFFFLIMPQFMGGVSGTTVASIGEIEYYPDSYIASFLTIWDAVTAQEEQLRYNIVVGFRQLIAASYDQCHQILSYTWGDYEDFSAKCKAERILTTYSVALGRVKFLIFLCCYLLLTWLVILLFKRIARRLGETASRGYAIYLALTAAYSIPFLWLVKCVTGVVEKFCYGFFSTGLVIPGKPTSHPSILLAQRLIRSLGGTTLSWNPEMGIDGSTTHPCHKKGLVGAIIRRTEGTREGSIIGHFFRVENYFVTAYHVKSLMVNDADEGTYIELAAYVERDGGMKIDGSKISPKRILLADIGKYTTRNYEAYSESRRKLLALLEWHKDEQLGGDSGDISASWLHDDFWARLGLVKHTLTTCKKNTAVYTTGPDLNTTFLVQAQGALKSVDRNLLHYTATTERGWSGSPIITNTGAIAVHTGTNCLENHGAPLIYLAPFMDSYKNPFGRRISKEDSADLDYNDKTGKMTYQGKSGTMWTQYMPNADYEVFWTTDQGEIYSMGDFDDLKHDLGKRFGGQDAEELMDEMLRSGNVSSAKSIRILRGELLGKKKQLMASYEHGDITMSPLSLQPSQIKIGENTIELDLENPNKKYKKLKKKNKNLINAFNNVVDNNIQMPSSLKLLEGVRFNRKGNKPSGKVIGWLPMKFVERAKEIGYEPGKYAFPEINHITEKRAFFEAFKSVKNKDFKVSERVMAHVLDALKELRYRVEPGYKTHANISRIINSNLIDKSKSPGRHYTDQGYGSNQQLVDGNHNLAQEVIDAWEESKPFTVFCKDEPHKKAKLDRGALRLIFGADIRDTVKSHALYAGLLERLSSRKFSSPLAYGWSHNAPGDIRVLASHVGDGQTGDADVVNWDTEDTGTLNEAINEVTIRLGEQSPRISDDEFRTWKKDVRKDQENNYKKPVMVLSNGEAYTQTVIGVQKSGIIVTLCGNSIGQVILHFMVLEKMGYLDRANDVDFRFAVMGDDTLHRFPVDFPAEEYFKEMSKLIPITYEIHPSLDGAGFCSQLIKKDKRYKWIMIPKRFTRIVEKLQATKEENRAQVLVQYMREYSFDDTGYGFFKSIYMHMNDLDDLLYPLSLLKSRDSVNSERCGFENGTIPIILDDHSGDLKPGLKQLLRRWMGGWGKNKQVKIKLHGNFCGPNWSDGKHQPSVSQSTLQPIDELDRACERHDHRYAKATSQSDLDFANTEFFRETFGKGIKPTIAALLVKAFAPNMTKTKGKKKGNLRGSIPTSTALVALTKAVSKLNTKQTVPRKQNVSNTVVKNVPLSSGTTIRMSKPLVRNTRNGTVITGREFLGNAANLVTSGFQLCALFPLHPYYFNSSVLGNVARVWEYYRWRNLRVSYISKVPTTANGDVVIRFNNQMTNPCLNGASGSFLQRVMSSNNALMGPVWSNHSVNIDVTRNEFMLVDCFVDNDPQDNIFGEIEAYTVYGSVDTVGYFVLDYTIEFKDLMLDIHSSALPWSLGQAAPFTFTSSTTTPTALDIAGYTNTSINASYALTGLILKLVYSSASTYGTGRTQANGFSYGTYNHSNSTTITGFTTNITTSLADGTIWYGVYAGTIMYLYLTMESALEGSSSNQIFYRTTGSSADSIVWFVYPIRLNVSNQVAAS